MRRRRSPDARWRSSPRRSTGVAARPSSIRLGALRRTPRSGPQRAGAARAARRWSSPAAPNSTAGCWRRPSAPARRSSPRASRDVAVDGAGVAARRSIAASLTRVAAHRRRRRQQPGATSPRAAVPRATSSRSRPASSRTASSSDESRHRNRWRSARLHLVVSAADAPRRSASARRPTRRRRPARCAGAPPRGFATTRHRRRRAARAVLVADPVARARTTSAGSCSPARAGASSATPPGSSIRSRARASTSRCCPAQCAADALSTRRRRWARYAEQVRDAIAPELARAARLKRRVLPPAVHAAADRGARPQRRRSRAVMADLVAGRQSYAACTGGC